MVKLKDCCSVVGGATPKRNLEENWNSKDIPWVTPKDISGLTNPILNDTPEYISKTGFKSCSTVMLPRGSVLLTSRAPIGNVAIAGKEMCTNQGFKSLVAKPDTSSKYLFHCIKHYIPQLQALGNGATFKEVSKKTVEEFSIPLPSLAEQNRIAAILDKADAIRRKRQQAIELADEFLRSVFLDMFGDSLSPLSKNSIAMTDCFDITTGKLNSNAAKADGEYPFFTCAKEVFAIDKFAFDHEALLLAGNNAQAEYDVKHYIGKFNAYQRTYVLTLKNKDWSYPFYKFALEYQLLNLKRASKGSSTKYITMEIMSRTMLPAPSTERQLEFVKYFTIHKKLKEKYAQSQIEANLQFESLSQKAFSGKL